jgi:probable rRNA maturation factor
MPVVFSNVPVKPHVSRAFFVSAARAVLTEHYVLSVAFVTTKEVRRLNRLYRGKNAPTDILAFPLSQNEGEMVFSMREVRAQAPFFGRRPDVFLKYLFIHGLLHLKGMKHGATMERQEAKLRRQFGI